MATAMASLVASVPASQVSSSSSAAFGRTNELAKVSVAPIRQRKAAGVVAMSTAPAYVPDMNRRNLMNLILAGGIALPGGAVLGGWLFSLVPPGSGGTGGGVVAKDAFGNDVTSTGWLASHLPNDRSLAEGLKGDPTYLVVEADGQLAPYGVNAVCTHLGCVVPWNPAENKFLCPCHGSQYNNQGRVVRGPAPLSLALAHVDVVDDKVLFSTWSETDFRTGEEPWWS
eukprot:TRINITY_DN3969_c0_g1_i1.p1 TRINITY_DN3969_c0_g1~~TRINITY_DN3969_c0_g1_i1.p1  ORF type:complete len:227 (-),score=31.68 TRINITY_DN3969_c0_g1_i1:397-1077(-)